VLRLQIGLSRGFLCDRPVQAARRAHIVLALLNGESQPRDAGGFQRTFLRGQDLGGALKG